jgi:hypothetical protein
VESDHGKHDGSEAQDHRRQAEAIVARTVRRGAISERRAGYWLAQAASGEDITILDELAVVDEHPRTPTLPTR